MALFGPLFPFFFLAHSSARAFAFAEIDLARDDGKKGQARLFVCRGASGLSRRRIVLDSLKQEEEEEE